MWAPLIQPQHPPRRTEQFLTCRRRDNWENCSTTHGEGMRSKDKKPCEFPNLGEAMSMVGPVADRTSNNRSFPMPDAVNHNSNWACQSASLNGNVLTSKPFSSRDPLSEHRANSANGGDVSSEYYRNREPFPRLGTHEGIVHSRKETKSLQGRQKAAHFPPQTNPSSSERANPHNDCVANVLLGNPPKRENVAAGESNAREGVTPLQTKPHGVEAPPYQLRLASAVMGQSNKSSGQARASLPVVPNSGCVLRPSPHATHPMLQQHSDNLSAESEVASWHDWQTTNYSGSVSMSRSPSSSFENASDEAFPQPNLSVQQSATGGNKKTQYHKTKLCPWHRDGKCFMGSTCNYAHNRSELRPKPDLSKTKLCPEVVKGRPCERPGCRFAHDFVELRATSTFFKTRICKFWQRGYCPAGDECRHAHGKEDLRGFPFALQIGEDYLSVTSDISRPFIGQQPSTLPGSKVSNDSLIPTAPGAASHQQKRPAIQFKEFDAWISHKAPLATALPSPSFLSTTASTPCAAQQMTSMDEFNGPALSGAGKTSGQLQQPQLGILLQRLKESIQPSVDGQGRLSPSTLKGLTCPSSPTSPTTTTMSVLKDWITQEVERQWVSRSTQMSVLNYCGSPSRCTSGFSPTMGSPKSQMSFEEGALLPQSVWQGLKGQSPMERVCCPSDGPDSPNFSEAVCRLLNDANAMAREPTIPAHLLLETLGELTRSASSPPGIWRAERPPICKAPFS